MEGTHGKTGTSLKRFLTDSRAAWRDALPDLFACRSRAKTFCSTATWIRTHLTEIESPSGQASTERRQGLDGLGPLLFQGLEIVRVYTKAPGRAPETTAPFTVRRGATVHDVARLVHKDIADSLRFARMWGSGVFDGQQVGPDHPVSDRDVVELHMR